MWILRYAGGFLAYFNQEHRGLLLPSDHLPSAQRTVRLKGQAGQTRTSEP